MAHVETAFAKLNLALHVRSRREDGYHELETLFAFVDAGDVLSANSAVQDEVRVVGEFAPGLTDPFGNLVSKALGVLPRADGLSITLEKNLPVAAGLGGGSADAGAVFRIVRDRHGLPADWQARASRLGADVPACVESVPCIGRGTGTTLDPVGNDLTGTPALLVNPRIPLSTGAVFAGWNGADLGAMTGGTMRQIAMTGRNDLEAPAIALCPAVGEVLAALRRTSAWLVRLSGSGATCFALFDDVTLRDEAAAAVKREWPGWWTLAGTLR